MATQVQGQKKAPGPPQQQTKSKNLKAHPHKKPSIAPPTKL